MRTLRWDPLMVEGPQLGSLHVPPQFMAMRRPLYSQKALCDGFVFPWDPEMEFEVIEAFERSIGKKCHAVGWVGTTVPGSGY